MRADLPETPEVGCCGELSEASSLRTHKHHRRKKKKWMHDVDAGREEDSPLLLRNPFYSLEIDDPDASLDEGATTVDSTTTRLRGGAREHKAAAKEPVCEGAPPPPEVVEATSPRAPVSEMGTSSALLRGATSLDVNVKAGVASETAELLLNSGLLGSRDPLCEALRAHRGGRFPQRLAREVPLAALEALSTPEAGDLAEAWRRSLEAPLPKPVSLGYSSGLRGGAPKQPRREEEGATASPELGKRAKAGEPQQLGGGYKVGDEVYYDGSDWDYDDDDDGDNILRHGTKGKVTGPATHEDCVGKGVEVDFGIHGRFESTFDLVCRRRRRRPPTLRSPPPCLPRPPRTPPRQHTNAA